MSPLLSQDLPFHDFPEDIMEPQDFPEDALPVPSDCDIGMFCDVTVWRYEYTRCIPGMVCLLEVMAEDMADEECEPWVRYCEAPGPPPEE